MNYMRTEWAFKASDSEEYHVTPNRVYAHEMANGLNETYRNAGSPITYTVYQRNISEWGEDE